MEEQKKEYERFNPRTHESATLRPVPGVNVPRGFNPRTHESATVIQDKNYLTT